MDAIASNFEQIAQRWSGGAELDTTTFVNACEHLGDVFNALGGPVFAFASVDYKAKVHSVKEAAAEHPTLDTIVATDVKQGRHMTQGSRARNLWRVLNALRILRQLLLLLEPEDACLRHAATHAYTETMAQTHLWAIRQMVYLALWASPTRDQFLTALATHDAGAPVEQIMKAARRYVVASEFVISRLDALYPGPCVDETGA